MSENKYLLHRVKFILLFAFQIPSIFISILLFIYFYKHRNLISLRHNQGLIILLIVNFCQVTFDLPMVIDFNRRGYVYPSTPGYCTWWTFFEYTLNGQSEMLMSTISIHRHIFIFHSNLFNNRLYRYLFHHLPLLFFLIYPIILYLIIVVFYPCDGTQWDYTLNVCGLANCYLVYNKVLGTYDWAVDNGLPMIIIIVANVTLIIRVIRQKRRQIGYISWKKQRRMTIQLLSISSLYFIGWFPNLVIGVVQQLYLPTFLIDVQFNYMFDLTYLICLFLPWIYFRLFPQFSQWIFRILFGHIQPQPNTVGPTIHRNQ